MKLAQKSSVLIVEKTIMGINVHTPNKKLKIIKKKNGLMISAIFVDRTFTASIEDMKKRFLIITKTYL